MLVKMRPSLFILHELSSASEAANCSTLLFVAPFVPSSEPTECLSKLVYRMIARLLVLACTGRNESSSPRFVHTASFCDIQNTEEHVQQFDVIAYSIIIWSQVHPVRCCLLQFLWPLARKNRSRFEWWASSSSFSVKRLAQWVATSA